MTMPNTLAATREALLALLRGRAPQAALWVTGGLAALVAITGLYWFVERVVAG